MNAVSLVHIHMAIPSQDEVERIARRSGLTEREYCLKQIERWKDMLETVSDDYRDISDKEFEALVEAELDQLESEND